MGRTFTVFIHALISSASLQFPVKYGDKDEKKQVNPICPQQQRASDH